MSVYFLKIRADECPDNDINPQNWRSKKFKLVEYEKNLAKITDRNSSKVFVWINENARKLEGCDITNGLGLTAFARISDIDVTQGSFKLSDVCPFKNHLNLDNFLSKSKTSTFSEAYRSQRVRVREMSQEDIISIAVAYGFTSF